MNGKTSIKSILPSLYPTASFDQLPISSGGSINHIYNKLGDSIDNESIIEELNLYSHMDTYAMVLIFKQLQKLSAFKGFSLFCIVSGIISFSTSS